MAKIEIIEIIPDEVINEFESAMQKGRLFNTMWTEIQILRRNLQHADNKITNLKNYIFDIGG